MNKKIYIKKSDINDSNFFYELRNDKANRRFSFNSKKTNFKNHSVGLKKI
jgi:hypothetical protein